MTEKSSKEQALELATELCENMESMEEERVDEIIGCLQELSPDPYICDYIFSQEGDEMSPEEIIEKAFSYKSIQL